MIDYSLDEASAILAGHQIEGRGMSHGAPDTCTCGAQTWPERGDEDVMVRRHRAFAQHQAEALAIGE